MTASERKPMQIHTLFKRTIEYPVTVIVPDGVRHNVDDGLIFDEKDHSWWRYQDAARRGLIAVEEFAVVESR